MAKVIASIITQVLMRIGLYGLLVIILIIFKAPYELICGLILIGLISTAFTILKILVKKASSQ